MIDPIALWRQLADELEASDPGISTSTMMGLPCLRLDGAFFASLDKRSGELIVKLAADDVAERIAASRGHAFAPAGRVFREWVVVDRCDEPTWRAALADALEFARMKNGAASPRPR
jgi:hypothetical protein